MITRGDKIVFGLIILLAIGAFFFLRERNQAAASPDGKKGSKEEKKDKKGKKKDKDAGNHDARVTIVRKWEMPSELKEISGIADIGGGRFACVQDELGIIYIYNTASKQIERQIHFGAAGDYEGIAVVDATAYVLRADGKLFEVQGFNSGKPSAVVQHGTHLTAEHDVEGLCFDRRNNRLLLAIKGKEPGGADYKGIYAFDLKSKKLAAAPVYRVGGANDAGKGKGKNKIAPSDLDIHPRSGDIYIVDGPGARLLILGPDGVQKEMYELSKSDFPQPEGLAFSQEGVLFVSNEGKNGAGNILELSVKEIAE